MRGIALVVCACLVLQSGASNDGAEARATAWLQAHKLGQPTDEGDLNDFAKSDPNGYALVKALMLKRSLGLLDPRKPTASFAAPATHANSDALIGAAAFGQFAAPGEIKKHAAMVAEVTSKAGYDARDVSDVSQTYMRAPASHGNAHSFDFKASDDDDMVASVLGQASQSTGGSPQGSFLSKSRDTSVTHLTTDEMMMGTGMAEASGIPTFVAPSSTDAALASLKSVAYDAPKEEPKATPINVDHVQVAPFVAPKLHLVPVEGVPPVKTPVVQVKEEAKVQEVHAPVAQATVKADNPYLQNIDFGSKRSAPAKPSMPADATPLDFNKEIARMAAVPAAKPQVSLSTQSQKVQSGSKFLDDIGFSKMLAGQDTFKFSWAADGRAVLDEPSSRASQVRPSLGKKVSMMKEYASVSDYPTSEGAVLSKFLGHEQTDDLEDVPSSQDAQRKEPATATNPYMTDLN